LLETPPDGVVRTTEIKPERHRQPGEILAAEGGVTARQRVQRGDWIALALDGSADVVAPCLIEQVEHGQDEGLVVFEPAI
jgi:hypothetical protein